MSIFPNIVCITILILILVGIWYILTIRNQNNLVNGKNKIEKTHQLYENGNNNIIFVSKEYINIIIDESNYFNRMNNIDLLVRDVNTIPSYIKIYKDGITEFTKEEKKILNTMCNSINKNIKNTKNLVNLQWKFAKQSSNIENGWPHTLGDVIILSSNFFNSSNQKITLLHEKIHIYQRIYPIETNKLFIEWKFKPAIKLEKIQLARNNPDINDFVYKKEDAKGNESKTLDKIIVQLYNSKNPIDISDSKPYIYNENENPIPITQEDIDISNIVSQYEHPNEIMATLIPQIIINNFDEKTDFIEKTKLWILRHL